MIYECRSDAPSSIEAKDDIQQRITSPPQILRVQTNHIFSMNHHAHRVYHQQPPNDIEALPNTYHTNVPIVQDKLPSHVAQASQSTATTTKDTQSSLPNNTSSLTEAGQYYYYNMDMDVHPLKQAQKRIHDADQMAKSSPLLLPIVCVTTVMVFIVGLFVLYQVHSSDVEK